MAGYETCVDRGEPCPLLPSRLACTDCGKIRPYYNILDCADSVGSAVDPVSEAVAQLSRQDVFKSGRQEAKCECEVKLSLSDYLLSLLGYDPAKKENIKQKNLKEEIVPSLEVVQGDLEVVESELSSKPEEVNEYLPVTVSRSRERVTLTVQRAGSRLHAIIPEEVVRVTESEPAPALEDWIKVSEPLVTCAKVNQEEQEYVTAQGPNQLTNRSAAEENIAPIIQATFTETGVNPKDEVAPKRVKPNFSRSPSKEIRKEPLVEGTPSCRGVSRSRSSSRSPTRGASSKGYCRRNNSSQSSHFSSLARRATTIANNTYSPDCSPTDPSIQYRSEANVQAIQRRSYARGRSMTAYSLKRDQDPTPENVSQNRADDHVKDKKQPAVVARSPESQKSKFQSCICPDVSPKSKCSPAHCSNNMGTKTTGPQRKPNTKPASPSVQANSKSPCCQSNAKNNAGKKTCSCGSHDIKCPCAGNKAKQCSRANWMVEKNKSVPCSYTESSYSQSKETGVRSQKPVAKSISPKQPRNEGGMKTTTGSIKSPVSRKSCPPNYCKRSPQTTKYNSNPSPTITRCEFRLVPTCIRKTGPKSDVEEYLSRFQIPIATIVRESKVDKTNQNNKSSGDEKTAAEEKMSNNKQGNAKSKKRRKAGGKGKGKKPKATQSEGNENGNANDGYPDNDMPAGSSHHTQIYRHSHPGSSSAGANATQKTDFDCQGFEEKGRCFINYHSELAHSQAALELDTLDLGIKHPYTHHSCNIHVSSPVEEKIPKHMCSTFRSIASSAVRNINHNALPPRKRLDNVDPLSVCENIPANIQGLRKSKAVSSTSGKLPPKINKNFNALPKTKVQSLTYSKPPATKNSNVNAIQKTATSKTSVASLKTSATPPKKSKTNTKESKTQSIPSLEKEIESKVQELKQSAAYATPAKYHESSFFSFGNPDSKRGDHGGEPHLYMPRRSFAHDFDPGEDTFLRDSWAGPRGPDERWGTEAASMHYTSTKEDALPELTSAISERARAVEFTPLGEQVKAHAESIVEAENVKPVEEYVTEPEEIAKEEDRKSGSERKAYTQEEDHDSDQASEEFMPFQNYTTPVGQMESSVDGEPIEMAIGMTGVSPNKQQIPVFASLFERFDDTVQIFVRTKTSGVDSEDAGPSGSGLSSSERIMESPVIPETGLMSYAAGTLKNITRPGLSSDATEVTSQLVEGTNVDLPNNTISSPPENLEHVPLCNFSPGTCVDPAWFEDNEAGYVLNYTRGGETVGSSVDPVVDEFANEPAPLPGLDEVMKGNALFFKKVEDDFDPDAIRSAKAEFLSKLKTPQAGSRLLDFSNSEELPLSFAKLSFQTSEVPSGELTHSMVDYIRLNGTPV